MNRFLPCFVVNFLMVATIACGAADHDGWHMEYEPHQRVSVTFFLNRSTPLGTITEYDAFAAVAPELAQQRQVRSSFWVNNQLFRVLYTNELSSCHRPIMIARIAALTPADRANITVSVTHEVTLYKRHLVPGAGTNVSPVLSSFERAVSMADSSVLDYKSATFASFLDKNQLRREPSEDPIAFGRRAQQFVQKNMTYIQTGNKSLSDTCVSQKGQCGEYAWMFVGIMRANGIPSRALVGHWVNTKPGHTSDSPHVKTEFFAEGVGWVPVDPGSSFGVEDGNFITFHLYLEEPMALPTPHWNVQKQGHLQGIFLPVVGASWDQSKMRAWTACCLIDSPKTPALQTTTLAGKPDIAPRLQELKSLFDQGLIDKNVYEQKKKEILDSL
jgi:hypothetical protein